MDGLYCFIQPRLLSGKLWRWFIIPHQGAVWVSLGGGRRVGAGTVRLAILPCSRRLLFIRNCEKKSKLYVECRGSRVRFTNVHCLHAKYVIRKLGPGYFLQKWPHNRTTQICTRNCNTTDKTSLQKSNFISLTSLSFLHLFHSYSTPWKPLRR